MPVPLRLNTRFAILTLVLFPCLIALGLWQLQRAEQKARLLATLEQRRAEAPLPFLKAVALGPDQLDYRRVALRGRYRPQHDFLLDNRVHEGRVGYELISAFETDDGSLVLLDRGWIEAPPTRDQLPAIPPQNGVVDLHAEIVIANGAGSTPMDPSSAWPKVIQATDVPQMSTLIGKPLYPHLLRLLADEPGALQIETAGFNIVPARHTAYAIQWFLMAAVLLVVFLLGSTNLRERWRSRPGEQSANE